MSQKEPHSYHIFLFPFKWETYQAENHTQSTLSKRYTLDKVPIDLTYWQKFEFKAMPDSEGFNTYGEYAYFYDHARDVLNMDDATNAISLRQFSYLGLTPSAKYHIDIKGNIYTLQLDNILLNCYENGVGILAFFLKNNHYSEKKTSS
jgi:hypothetical protein